MRDIGGRLPERKPAPKQRPRVSTPQPSPDVRDRLSYSRTKRRVRQNPREREQYLRRALRSVPNEDEERVVLSPRERRELNAARTRMRSLEASMMNPAQAQPASKRGKPLSERELRQVYEAKLGQQTDIFREAGKARREGGVLRFLEADFGPAGEFTRGERPFDWRVGADFAQIPILTMFGPIRGAKAGVAGGRALLRGSTAAEAKEVGRAAYRAPGLTTRAFRLGKSKVVIPAARSRSGRVVERFADSIRPAVAKTGAMRSEAEMFGAEQGRSIRYRQKLQTATADALKKIGRKLNDEQQYVLRVLAEQVPPAERIAHHVSLAAEADADEAIYHQIHASLLQKASKYVDTINDPERGPIAVLRADAPPKLHKAWELLQSTGLAREELYQHLGRLTDEQIVARHIAPGRVIRGARYRSFESSIQDALERSPVRAQVFEAIDSTFDDPIKAQAQKALFDAQIRSMAERVADDPQAVDQFLARLAGVEQIDELSNWGDFDVLYQSIPEAPELPDAIQGGPLHQAFYELVRAGAAFRDWYDRAARVVAQIAEQEGVTFDEMAQVVAITSQGANPTFNLRLAVNAVRQFKDNGKVLRGYIFDEKKVEGVLRGQPWEGRKTNSFYMNITSPADAVTVDRHIARAAHGIDSPSKKQYDEAEQAIRDIAAQLGWQPKEVQAAAWIPIKAQGLADSTFKRMAKKHGWTEPRPREHYFKSAGDAYERGLGRYEKGTLLKQANWAPGYEPGGPLPHRKLANEDLDAINERLAGEAFNERTLSNDIPGLSPEANAAVRAGVKDTLEGSGGHTWNSDLTSLPTDTGYAVGVSQERGVTTPAARFDETDVAAFRQANDDVFQLEPKLKIGSWNDGENVHLDISLVTPNLDEALAIGRQQNQQAIFDFATKQDIPVEPQVLTQRAEESGFHDAARESLDEYAALARDVARTLPEEEWPPWVRNQIRRQAHGDKQWWEKGGTPLRGGKPGDPDATPGDLTLPEDWLTQRGGSLDVISTYGIKGAIVHRAVDSMIYTTSKADETTLAHELAHFVRKYGLTLREEKRIARYVGAEPIRAKREPGQRLGKIVGYRWTEEAEEKFARGIESFLRTGRGPTPLKQQFESLSKSFREIYADGELPELPAHVARTLEKLFKFSPQKGGRLVGAEGSRAGLVRVPYKPAMPISLANETGKSVEAYVRRTLALFGSGRKQAVGAGADDIALRKAFKARGLLTGFFDIDVTKASANELILAARVASAAHAREVLVRAGSEIPQNVTDVAIKVDPKIDASPKLKEFWQKVDSLEGKEKLTERDLRDFDFDLVESMRGDLFPGELEGRSIHEIAAEILSTNQPIPNIVWVPREALDASGLLMQMPRGSRSTEMTRQGRVIRGAAAFGWDAVNDVQKALILQLNPAYYVLNLGGNLVMNALQQGPFMFANLARSVAMHRAMDPIERLVVDKYMGHGLVAALSMRTTPGRAIQSTIGHWGNVAVDLIPRRSAFLHEARREGYKNLGDLKGLIRSALDGDESAINTMEQIARRANDAIVDYERMTPFEREVLSRIIFFYPWLRGATRYSGRFIMDHPIQAMGIALALEHAQASADERLGERPSYAKWDIPISTESVGLKVPFTDIDVGLDQAVGKHEMTENILGEELPEVFQLRQALTSTTPIDLLSMGIGFAFDPGSSEAKELVGSLTPFPYAAGVALYGKDPFTGEDVPQGLKTFMAQLSPKSMPLAERLGKIRMSDEERAEYQEKAIRPRSREDEINRTFLGGYAPAPYRAEVGERRAARDLKGAEQLIREAELDAEEAGFGPLPDEVKEDLQWRAKLEKKLRRGMSYSQRAEKAAEVYNERFDDTLDVSGLPEDRAREVYELLRAQLWPSWKAWDAAVDKVIDAQLEG